MFPGRTHPPSNPSPPGRLQAGWSARLAAILPRSSRARRTVLRERSHVGPLRVLKPLYPEGDAVCHAVLVHPPGGIVEGDSLSVEVTGRCQRPDHHAGRIEVVSLVGRTASAETHLTVADGASLEWLPQEAMAHDGARAQQRFTIALAPTARFFGWEMLCLGRTTAASALPEVASSGKASDWCVPARCTVMARIHASGRQRSVADVAARPARPAGDGHGMDCLESAADGGGTDAVLAKVRDALAEPLAAASAPDEGLIVVKAIGDAPEAVRNC